MTEINLLPWRELRREREKKEFTIYLLAGFITAVFLVFLMHYYASSVAEAQRTINTKLNEEISRLNSQITEINQLKKLKQALVARMSVIKNLQLTRPLTVHLFDELVTITPSGVYLSHLDRVGNKVTILGYADSNTDISQLMRNIEKNNWIQEPELTEIKKDEKVKDLPQQSAFKLSFKLVSKKMSEPNEKSQLK